MTRLGGMTVSAGVKWCLLGVCVLACRPSYDERSIKTPAERLRDQEEAAYRAELERRKRPQDTQTFEDPDAPGAFDHKGAELELKRATRSAETCPAVADDGKVKPAKTSVTLVFAKDGSVAEATVPPPFADTRLGNCVLNAYRGLFVQPYAGEREVITWDVDLTKAQQK